MDFVSRLPDRFSLRDQLVQGAWEQGSWVDVGSLSPGKEAAHYRMQDAQAQLEGRTYRFVIVHSNKLDERKRKTWERQLQKEREELKKACAELQRQLFHCVADAQEQADQLQRGYDGLWQLAFEVSEEKETQKRARRGRPRKEESVVDRTVYRAVGRITGLDEAGAEAAKAKLGTFVLITKLSKETASALEVLTIYKGQEGVENRFRFLKNPQQIGPIYLKNSERLHALAYVFLIALLIYSLLERRIRQRLAVETEPPLVLPGERKSKQPTANMLLILLSRIQVLIFQQGEERVRALNRLKPETERVIRLAGFEPDIYVTEKAETCR